MPFLSLRSPPGPTATAAFPGITARWERCCVTVSIVLPVIRNSSPARLFIPSPLSSPHPCCYDTASYQSLSSVKTASGACLSGTTAPRGLTFRPCDPQLLQHGSCRARSGQHRGRPRPPGLGVLDGAGLGPCWERSWAAVKHWSLHSALVARSKEAPQKGAAGCRQRQCLQAAGPGEEKGREWHSLAWPPHRAPWLPPAPRVCAGRTGSASAARGCAEAVPAIAAPGIFLHTARCVRAGVLGCAVELTHCLTVVQGPRKPAPRPFRNCLSVIQRDRVAGYWQQCQSIVLNGWVSTDCVLV